MRCTVLEIKAKGAMPTSEASMTPIKGANVISKADVAHVMEESVLQTAVVAVVDNAALTRKWSSLEVTSMNISVLI
jgi:hypothetical protein